MNLLHFCLRQKIFPHCFSSANFDLLISIFFWWSSGFPSNRIPLLQQKNNWLIRCTRAIGLSSMIYKQTQSSRSSILKNKFVINASKSSLKSLFYPLHQIEFSLAHTPLCTNSPVCVVVLQSTSSHHCMQATKLAGRQPICFLFYFHCTQWCKRYTQVSEPHLDPETTENDTRSTIRSESPDQMLVCFPSKTSQTNLSRMDFSFTVLNAKNTKCTLPQVFVHLITTHEINQLLSQVCLFSFSFILLTKSRLHSEHRLDIGWFWEMTQRLSWFCFAQINHQCASANFLCHTSELIVFYQQTNKYWTCLLTFCLH